MFENVTHIIESGQDPCAGLLVLPNRIILPPLLVERIRVIQNLGVKNRIAIVPWTLTAITLPREGAKYQLLG